MPGDVRPLLGSWTWRCADCQGVLVWVRDTFQGRRLLAVLVHEAEASAEELMARGMLRFAPDSLLENLWLCCCDNLGPTLSAEILAARFLRRTVDTVLGPRTGS